MKIITFPFVDELLTPIGKIAVKATQNHIHQIYFLEENHPQTPLNPNELTATCIAQLHAYFEGNLQQFNFPIQQDGTEFQQSVWNELQKISFGDTLSYTQLAERIGHTNQVRAVANSNAKNNLAIVVPCHRIIAQDGKLTGYAWGLKRKQWLLDFEGRLTGKKLSLF
jgi:methylated-DNA-[protein]-cysteine S-methyltransferase